MLVQRGLKKTQSVHSFVRQPVCGFWDKIGLKGNCKAFFIPWKEGLKFPSYSSDISKWIKPLKKTTFKMKSSKQPRSFKRSSWTWMGGGWQILEFTFLLTYTFLNFPWGYVSGFKVYNFKKSWEFLTMFLLILWLAIIVLKDDFSLWNGIITYNTLFLSHTKQ